MFEVFVGGGAGQRDALLSCRGGHLVNVEPGTGLSKDSTTIGTRITIETDKGKSTTRTVIGTVGMLTDQTPELSFGLGDHERIVRAVIQHPNGQTEVIEAPTINRKIRLN